jgi:hypothetical protein
VASTSEDGFAPVAGKTARPERTKVANDPGAAEEPHGALILAPKSGAKILPAPFQRPKCLRALPRLRASRRFWEDHSWKNGSPRMLSVVVLARGGIFHVPYHTIRELVLALLVRLDRDYKPRSHTGTSISPLRVMSIASVAIEEFPTRSVDQIGYIGME